jgi:hypothetical protein
VPIVNIGFPIWNFGLACIIAVGNFELASDSFSGFLPFVSFDDIFHCYEWLLACTFFIAFACDWSGVGSGVLQVQGGDRRGCSSSGDFYDSSRIGDGCGFSIIGGNCSWIRDRTSYSEFGDGGRHALGDIEAGKVNAEAVAAGSITIEVHLH